MRATNKPPGPSPDRLKLEGNWKDAAKKAMASGKPPGTKQTAKKKKPRGK